MHIDLNNPEGLTPEAVRQLLASASDDVHTQLRVSKDGRAYLSSGVVGGTDIDGLLSGWKPGQRVPGMWATLQPVMRFGSCKSSMP